MSSQPDEPQGKWHFEAGQLWRFREGALLRIESVNLDTVEYVTQRADGSWPQLPITLHKHHLIESMTKGGAALIEPIDERIAKLEAANHELGESLMLMSEKYQAMAGERDGLEAELQHAKQLAAAAVDELQEERLRINCGAEHGAVDCGQCYVGEVTALTAELSAIDAALARRPAFDDLNTRAEKVWRACDTAARLDRRLADARGYKIRFKTLEPKLKDCEQALQTVSDECAVLRQQRAAAGKVRAALIDAIMHISSERKGNIGSIENVYNAQIYVGTVERWRDALSEDVAAICGTQERDK